jgi:hypothetical protein
MATRYGETFCEGAKWLYAKTVDCCAGCKDKCAEKYGKVDDDDDDEEDGAILVQFSTILGNFQ